MTCVCVAKNVNLEYVEWMYSSYKIKWCINISSTLTVVGVEGCDVMAFLR